MIGYDGSFHTNSFLFRIKKYEEWQKEKKHRMKEIQNRANTIKKPQNDNSASHQQANLRNQNGAAGSDPGQSSVVAAGSSSPEDNPDKDNLVMSNAIEDHEPLTYREAISFFITDIKYLSPSRSFNKLSGVLSVPYTI